MLRHPGNLIGDSWFYVDNEMAHCFYLTCPSDVPRHTDWDIGHATSTDLVNWTIHPSALVHASPGAWDDGLATGSVIRWNGQFWMAYCSSRSAQVGMAVSDDLMSWKKCPGNPVTGIDARYYEEIGSGTRPLRHWRDPFLWADGEWVYHYVCASKNNGKNDERGALGLARTRNMTRWEILAPPEVDPVAQELECSQLYFRNGKWYLVFSTITEFFSSKFLTEHPAEELGWSTYSMVGPSPFGPFRITGTGRILPPSYPVQPYACQLVTMKQHTYLLGTLVQAEGDAICDPIPVVFTDTGVQSM